MSAVQKAIADIVAESARTRVVIPVATAGGGGGPAVAGSGTPSAAGVFGASRAFVQGNFGGIDRFTAPGFSAPLGAGAATSAFFGASPLSFSGAFSGLASPAFVPTVGVGFTGSGPHAETILSGGGAGQNASNANVVAGAAAVAAARVVPRPTPRAVDVGAGTVGVGLVRGSSAGGFTMGGPATGGGQPGAALAILDPPTSGGGGGGGWTWGRGSAAGAAAAAGAIIPVPVRRVNIPGGGAGGFVGEPGFVNAGYSAAFRAGISDWADEQFAAARARGGGTVGGRGLRAPGGGFGASNRFLGGQLWGIGGLIGLGTGVNVIAQGIYGQRTLDMETMLAAGQPAGELAAQLQYREHIAASGGFIGRFVAYAQDPSGGAEAGIRATIRQSELQGAATDRMRGRFEFSQSLRDQTRVAAALSPYGRRLAEIDVEKARIDREIQATRIERGAASAEEIRAERVRLQSTYEDRVNERFKALAPRQFYWENPAAYTAAQNQISAADNASIATMQQQRAGVNQKLFDADRALSQERGAIERIMAARSEGYRRIGVAAESDAAIDVAGAIGRNDPVGAHIAGIRGRRRLALNAARERGADAAELGGIWAASIAEEDAVRATVTREFGFAAADVAGAARVNALILRRDPVGARVAAAREAAAAQARRLPDTVLGRALGAIITAGAESEVAVIRREAEDVKRYRRMQLEGDEAALRLQIDDRPLAAIASQRKDSAVQLATQLREKEDDPANANRVLNNAILEQEAFRKQILRGFDAESADPRLTAINGPRAGEDVGELLASIDQNTGVLAANVQQNGGAAVTVP